MNSDPRRPWGAHLSTPIAAASRKRWGGWQSLWQRARGVLNAPRSPGQLLRLFEPIALLSLWINALPDFLRSGMPAHPLTGGAFAMLAAFLFWSMRAFWLDRPQGQWTHFVRGLLVFACAVPLSVHSRTGELVWIIATVGLYPIAMRRYQALAFGAAVVVLDALWLHGPGQLPILELIQHAGNIVVFAFLANLLGRSVVQSALALDENARSEMRFDALAAHAPMLIQVVDADFQLVYVNTHVRPMFGYGEEEFRRLWGSHLIHPDDLDAVCEAIARVKAQRGVEITVTARARHKNGSWRWFDARATNLLDSPAVRGIVVTSLDVTDRKAAEQRVFEECNRFRTVVEAVPEFVFAKDLEGRYAWSNAANLQRLGLEAESQLAGKLPRDVYPPGMASEVERDDRQVLETGTPILNQQALRDWSGRGEARWLEFSKIPLRDREERIVGLIAVVRDIHVQKEIENVLAHQALHDGLTGLPNRRHLVRELERELARGSGPEASQCALLYCDLDFFKSVNDHFGHEVGDRFLVNLCDRIRLCLGPTEMLARLGGDEFVILCREILDQAEALRLARRVLKAVQQPVVVESATLRVEASIGIALSRPGYNSPDELIRDADAAMYKAKEEGRSRIAVFDEESRQRAMHQTELAQSLQSALERGELSLVYQPKISLRDGSLTGFEALLRWKSPEHGDVPPSVFVPIAEQSALISSIGLWTLQEACWQFCTWQRRHPHAPPMSVAINVSMRQMLTDSFVLDVQRIIEQTGVDPGSVELEVTETAVMANPNRTAHMLGQLKELGVRIALDDFGTGYSSLAYIRRLPIDVIKVDRAFVDGLGREQNDTEIVRLVLALATTLRLQTVAEGIETPESLSELVQLGCDIGQGYLLSEPLDAESARALLAAAPAPVITDRHFSV
jgi:diguanylate cyclase (GGDEF)-like protein/PAS domain S-box-containing protein